MKRSKELFTASDVARFCQVDLKTIHNWADRGEIRHFRTPGRHLRFQRGDVLDFLRRYGYPVPAGLVDGVPRLVLVEDDAGLTEAIVDRLGEAFRVDVYQCPYRALLAAGAAAPDGFVFGALGESDASSVLRAVTQSETTRGARVFRLGSRTGPLSGDVENAAIVLAADDLHSMARTLTEALGTDRGSR